MKNCQYPILLNVTVTENPLKLVSRTGPGTQQQTKIKALTIPVVREAE